MKMPASARSTSGLRGDYVLARGDYTVDQDWAAYTPAMHDRWRRLHARQHRLAERHAALQVVKGLDRFDSGGGIPDFEKANALLCAVTGWALVAVPGFIPEAHFFDHLARRHFPVTRWLREESEFDYLVEPDAFHDFFGHVPLLLDPAFSDFLQAYGKAGERAMALDALPMLARIYWYTVEFGLIDEGDGLKAYGAGLVSSPGELVHATTSDAVRLPFDPLRIMRTDYAIDAFQKVYFVIGSMNELISGLVDLDFGPIYDEVRNAPSIPPGALLDGETVWTPRSSRP